RLDLWGRGVWGVTVSTGSPERGWPRPLFSPSSQTQTAEWVTSFSPPPSARRLQLYLPGTRKRPAFLRREKTMRRLLLSAFLGLFLVAAPANAMPRYQAINLVQSWYAQ